MVGWAVGLAVGFSVGLRVGLAVGDSVGTREGAAVGDRVGNGTTSGKSVGFLKLVRLTLDRLPPEIARIASAFAPHRQPTQPWHCPSKRVAFLNLRSTEDR
jgi:hypothetical protein